MNSYLKFLSRNKLYTAIQAAGLIVSIAFVILIGNHIWQHLQISRENPIGNRVYAVVTNVGASLSWWDKPVLEDKLPEAEAVCRIGATYSNFYWATIGDRNVKVTETDVDASFFEVFPNYTLLDGSMQEFALQDHCLVSESFARANWEGSPVGQTLVFHNNIHDTRTLTVCGVYADFRDTMMPESDLLLNSEFDSTYSADYFQPFSRIGSHATLIKVRPDTDRTALEEKIRQICRENYDEEVARDFFVEALPEYYFTAREGSEGSKFTKGNKAMLRILLMVVLLLLVSAVFNYINLSLALSGRRAKEMATRRLLGASQTAIALKYIAESLFFTAACFGLALLLAHLLLPTVDVLLTNVSGKGVHLQLSRSAGVVAVYAAGVLVVGVLAGLAPAWLASRFAPIDVVRGTFRRRSKMTFSKVFIVFQNVVSVVLIAMAVLMEVQLRHMAERPLNARTEGLYNVYHIAKGYADLAPLIDRVEQIPGVKRTAYGQGHPGQTGWMDYTFDRIDDEGTATTQMILCTEDYFDMLELNIVEDFGMPRTGSVWMSRSLATELGVEGEALQDYAWEFRINGARITAVGGIYEDYPTADVLTEDALTNSVVIIGRNEDMRYVNGFVAEVSGNYAEVDKAIREAYAEFVTEQYGIDMPSAQIGYVGDLINECLQPARTTMRLIELFMALSMLISLLGLVAMSTYFSGESTKGIAIRKVFGSNVHRELWRTVSAYMTLVAIAVVVGIPVAVYAAGEFLSRFAYRIANYWWIFVVAAALSVAFAFGSVLWQVLRAARTNPATELKKE